MSENLEAVLEAALRLQLEKQRHLAVSLRQIGNMMIYCFDTSALNHLHDDPEAATVPAGLPAANTGWITALSVNEVGITEDAERRTAVLQQQRKLTGDSRPLQIPNRLIGERAAAYAAGLDRAV